VRLGELEQILKDSLRVFMERFADQDGLEGSKTTAFSKISHPEISSMRARRLQRPNRGEGPCVLAR
jgi:hypothetical protein